VKAGECWIISNKVEQHLTFFWVLQDISIAIMSPCPGEPTAIAGQENIDTTAVVALEGMKRFANDNFKFVVKRDPSKFGLPKDDHGMLTDDDIPEEEVKTSEETNVRACRMTPYGYEYVSEFKIEDLPSYGDAEPDPRGNEQGLRHRSLVVGVIGGRHLF
jgi:hypothetical protein